ncbi:MAG: alpha-mannosidase [Clostridia bacterium]|nr:alpha-mannosidase [Clostridia bacterium]
MSDREKRLTRFLVTVKSQIVKRRYPCTDITFAPCGYKCDEPLPTEFAPFEKGMRWGEKKDSHCLFNLKFTLPESEKDSSLRLRVDTDKDGWNVYNPQFIIYENGKALQGLDTNHRTVEISYKQEYNYSLYAYTGSLVDNLPLNVEVEVYDADTKALYYDLLVPFEICKISKPDSREYEIIMDALIGTLNKLDLRIPCSDEFYASVKTAREYLKENLYEKYKGGDGTTAICIGHTHIDIAWLWTLAQTREKAQHSFATVLALLERYPEYIFMSSQPQLFDYIKQEDPALYARVKEMVALGRIEPEGSMWVEADCNLSSGESLVRQIIHGKRFFKEEFGVDNHILWLPDVFGYSAALPQICVKSGIDTFLTSKISWNDTNRMPYDTFIWKGIDGTGIFTYFLTAQDKQRGVDSTRYTTYVATTDPACVAGAYDRYSQKSLTDKVLVTVGWGDGGGATTEKMVEKGARLYDGLPGCPKVEYVHASKYLKELKDSTEGKLPNWRGELYLEYHRGTYTSAAKNKLFNRKSENLLRLLETALSVNSIENSKEFPLAKWDELWKIILLNQFHDIIPGSSIPEVYADSRKQYEELFSDSQKLLSASLTDLLGKEEDGEYIAAFNPLPFEFSGAVGEYEISKVPAKGFARVKALKARCNVKVDKKQIISDKYTVTFDDDYNIVSVKDTKGTEYINGKGNYLYACEDIPLNYDSWNVEDYHEEKKWLINDVSEVSEVTEGHRKGLRIVRKFMNSVITQYITLSDYDGRIDFSTTVEWNEKNLLLKTAFDGAVNTDTAIYDIQFGHVSRPTHKNTSWDQARFEVCAHKYGIVADHGKGIALLNDCKYGYSADGSTIRLSLIKCSGYANEFIDLDTHSFTYSLLPFKGDFRDAGVIESAYALNEPPVIYKTAQGETAFAPFTAKGIGVYFETFCPSEDGKGYILRGYEGHNSEAEVTVKFNFPHKKAYVCDLTEKYLYDLPADGTLTLKPFEIITIKAEI